MTLEINDVMAKWPTVTDAFLEFYDVINKEKTRDRRLFQKYLKKLFNAIDQDLVLQKGGDK